MPSIHTRGFRTILELSDHFLGHGARLGLTTEEEYAIFADNVLRTPRPDTALEFTRKRNGDLVRDDQVADVSRFSVKWSRGVFR